MFVELKNGSFIAAEQIELIRYGKRGATKVTTKDGDVFETACQDPSIESMKSPVVPAQPGYFRIIIDFDMRGFNDLVPIPIVAWRVSEYGGAIPITLQVPDTECYAVLCPDGRVFVPYPYGAGASPYASLEDLASALCSDGPTPTASKLVANDE